MNQPLNPATSSNLDTGATPDVHQSIGWLTRQLHDSLNGLGLTEKVKGLAIELPDAQSRLSYIARLTGEAAEKVLNRVDQAKAQHTHVGEETRRLQTLIDRDPTEAVAGGHVRKYLVDVTASNHEIDQHLNEIIMAQDFHDLTGQVITRVVNLAAGIEKQLIELLILTAPVDANSRATRAAPSERQPHTFSGPAINPQGNPDVVSSQSEVDGLLASLGF